jgi:hypothetical protein
MVYLLESIPAVLILWSLGLIARRDPSDRAQGFANFALLPFTIRHVGDSDPCDRTGTAIVSVILWVAAIVVMVVVIHGFLWDNWGGCPAGQHLEGGQMGTDTSCEYNR